MERQPKPAAKRARSGPRRAAASRLRTPADAAADVDRVVETYITEVILEENPGDEDGMYWWWPRAAWVDPNQLIVDTDNGGLCRVPYTTNDQQEVTFAAPIEVLEQFVDLSPSAKAQVLVAAHADTKPRSAMRVFESREDVPGLPQRDPEAGVGDGSNNVGMNRDQLCEALGLPTTATDAEVDAATAARKAELDAAEGEGGGEGSGSGAEGGESGSEGSGSEGGEGEGSPAGGEGGEGSGGEQPPAPAASGPRAGMVEVPAETWEAVQSGAQAGARVAAENEESRRDSTIAQACSDGKISPAMEGSMQNLHERDPEAFYNLLTASVDKGGLAKNLVPVSSQGGAGKGQDAAASATVSDAEMARMFPEVAIPAAGGRG